MRLYKIICYTFLLLLIQASVTSCKKKKDTTATNVRKESGEVEPDQLRPELDTRFQEKFFHAQLEKAKGNVQQAYNLFHESLKFEPKNAASHYEIGRIDLKTLINPELALSHAKVCVEQDKTNPWYHLLMGECYMGLVKYDLAVKSFREVAKLNPDDPEILYQIATAQLYAGKTSDAIATYDELERKSGPYEELSLQKHQLYMEIKDITKAGMELEKLANAFPEEPRYWGMAVQFYQKNGNAVKAEEAMNEMLKSDLENGQVHYQLSEYYAAKGEDKKSYDELKLAFKTTDVSIDQKVMILLRYLTLTDIKPEFLPQAYELLALTDQTYPNEAKTHSIYGDFLYRDGRRVEALARYRKSAELDASKKMIWEQILTLESELSDFKSMAADSRKAMEYFPSQPEFYYYNGLANQRLLEYDKAIDSYSIGKELVIDNKQLLSQFYSSLGETYHYQGNHEKSDQSYDESLRIEPENAFVLNNYSYYLSLRKVKLEKASQMSKRSNELSPGQASFEDTYAWVLFQEGKYAEALIWIEKSLSHGIKNGELLEHQGDILFRLGRTADAVEKWKEAALLGGAGEKIQQKIEQQKFID